MKYFSEGFVYVANETTIQRQLREQSNERMPVITKSDDDWVARILEVRAMDEHHVYARVYWMYWPDELPHGTHDGKKSIQGRQPYHSRNELIASNHSKFAIFFSFTVQATSERTIFRPNRFTVDIINVVSVTAPATVKQWDVEGSDIEGTLFWRQAFDVRTYELSVRAPIIQLFPTLWLTASTSQSIEGICVCKQPENPDKVLVGCSSQTCNVWFHAECLEKEAMVRAYERLGKTKPHIVPSTVKQEQDGDGESVGKRPLSPTEPPAAESAQQSIDVKQDTNGEPIKKQDNEEVKHADDEAPLGVPEDLPVHKNDSDAKPLTSETGPRPRGRPRKRPVETNGNVPSADALFKVTANMEATPSVFEIEDLRPDVVGGVKKWEEPIRCLACHTRIH